MLYFCSKNCYFLMYVYTNPGNSPWPFLIGVTSLSFMLSFMLFLNNGNMIFFKFSFMLLILLSSCWFLDLQRESLFGGGHTIEIQDCFKFSMVLFIFSECMFFFSFFWAFFHASLSPSASIGLIWPPVGLIPLDPFSTPLLNTCILLSSGLTLTISHFKLLMLDSIGCAKFLFMTLVLGYLFTRYQYFEYKVSGFTFSDSVYGSCFFMATGFHGIHVMVGTLFLFVCWIRSGSNIENDNYQCCEYTVTHHVSFELAIWYWHFVDVVWLFLYIVVYIWGS